jgi:hypothetical protein
MVGVQAEKELDHRQVYFEEEKADARGHVDHCYGRVDGGQECQGEVPVRGRFEE